MRCDPLTLHCANSRWISIIFPFVLIPRQLRSLKTGVGSTLLCVCVVCCHHLQILYASSVDVAVRVPAHRRLSLPPHHRTQVCSTICPVGFLCQSFARLGRVKISLGLLHRFSYITSLVIPKILAHLFFHLFKHHQSFQCRFKLFILSLGYTVFKTSIMTTVYLTTGKFFLFVFYYYYSKSWSVFFLCGTLDTVQVIGRHALSHLNDLEIVLLIMCLRQNRKVTQRGFFFWRQFSCRPFDIDMPLWLVAKGLHVNI